MRRSVLYGFSCACALAGATVGCTLDLQHRLACGDGFVDLLAGEECDPNDPQSPHHTACVDQKLGEGQAVCNDECRIEISQDLCARCGDRIVAGSEQCDGDDLNGQVCPSGEGALACSATCTLDASGCEPCGDAVVQPPEECDVRRCVMDDDCRDKDPKAICDETTKTCVSEDELLQPTLCADLDVTASLPKDAYVSGVVGNDDCATACFFDRRGCNFCGDGVVDDKYEDQGPFTQKAEVCDGEDANQNALADYCEDLCTDGNGTTLHLRCDFGCKADCSGFLAAEDPRCCVVGGEPCDIPNGFPCCWELDYPDEDPAAACQLAQNMQLVCNSTPPAGGN